MGFKLNTKKPYGRITGTLEDCPGAASVQDDMYFDARGHYLMDTDGTTESAPAEEEKAIVPERTGADLESILKKSGAKIPPFLIPLSDDEVIQLLVMAREKDSPKTVISAIELEAEERAGPDAGFEEE